MTPHPPQQPPKHLLLAEDDAVLQAVTLAVLRALDLAVDIASDGQDAVQMAQRTAYDLVLMDVHMPRLDGLEATRRIRSLGDHGRMPIVALTGQNDAQDIAACLAAGMNDHLAKPATPQQLVAMVAKWLSLSPIPHRITHP